MSIRLIAVLTASLLLSGCASWLFGSADTDEQTLYRKAGEYVYTSIPVEIYVGTDEADPGVVKAACKAEQAVYEALTASMDSFAATGQRLPVGFLDVTKALGVFASKAFGAKGIPDDPVEAIKSTKIMISVGIAAVPAMREYRRKDLRPKLNAMVSRGVPPTGREWGDMRALVDSQHAAIAAGCA